MIGEERLASLYVALRSVGLPCLVMGGHAVRHYGIDRNTIDYDLHVGLDEPRWKDLQLILGQSPMIAAGMLEEGTTWRPGDFRRFIVGTLPDGREERLEFWRWNHLLGPFDELWARREEGSYGGQTIAFMGIDDLIHSKETERDDDWRDVALLEEIADERRLVSHSREQRIAALASLRSNPGFDRARAMGLLDDAALVESAIEKVRHPIAGAYLAPYQQSVETGAGLHVPESIRGLLKGPLRHVAPGTPRHLALVEALRRLYRQAAMATDRADKQRILAGIR